jgi:hypothetical protein
MYKAYQSSSEKIGIKEGGELGQVSEYVNLYSES